MKYYSQFSVGDYELDSAYFAGSPFAPANYKPTYYDPQTGKTSTTPISRKGGTVIPNAPLPKGTSTPRNPTSGGMVHVKGKGKTYSEGMGIRKAHIRNVAGKVRMIGQSILKAGRKTAGALKANPKIAGAAAVGAGGMAYMHNRKKKRRI